MYPLRSLLFLALFVVPSLVYATTATEPYMSNTSTGSVLAIVALNHKKLFHHAKFPYSSLSTPCHLWQLCCFYIGPLVLSLGLLDYWDLTPALIPQNEVLSPPISLAPIVGG